jgi:hypothetical protein
LADSLRESHNFAGGKVDFSRANYFAGVIND